MEDDDWDYASLDLMESWTQNIYPITSNPYSEELKDMQNIANAAVKALERGDTLDQLIKRNPSFKKLYKEYKAEQAAIDKAKAANAARLEKEAGRRAAEVAARTEIAAKLTPEELAVFGLNEQGAKKRAPVKKVTNARTRSYR